MKLTKIAKFTFELIKSAKVASSTAFLAQRRANAQKVIATVSNETWDKISESIFRTNVVEKTPLISQLDDLDDYYRQNASEIDEKILKSIAHLREKAQMFAERMRAAIDKGKTPLNTFDYCEKFKKANSEDFEIIQDYIKSSYVQTRFETLSDFGNFGGSDKKLLCDFRIGEAPKEFLNADGIYYHGTTHKRKIFKNGFSLLPKKSQEVQSARELGQAVYLTPDRKVASKFAGLFGTIMQAHVNTKKVAIVNSEQLDDIISEIIHKSVSEEIKDMPLTPQFYELAIKKLFQHNGYNAAYTRQSISAGILGKMQAQIVDNITGGAQSQLAVFDPNDIKIVDKTLSDYIKNQSLQLCSWAQTPVVIIKSIYNTIKQIRGMSHS